MVLDGASGPPGSDFGGDSSAASDMDPSSPHLEAPIYVRIKAPFFFRLLGVRAENIRDFCNSNVIQHSKVLQRPLTQEEAVALTEHSMYVISTSSALSAVGAGFGVLRAIHTRSTYRFPFYQPKPEKFNPSQFAFLRGRNAMLLWHACRVGAYAAMGTFAGLLFGSNYAIATAAAHEIRDGRLKELNRELAEKKRANLQQRRGARSSTAGGLPNTQTARTDGYTDEASPTSGYYGDGNGSEDNSYGGLAVPGRNGNNDGMLSDQEMRAMERRQQASRRDSPTSSVSSTYDMDKVARQPSSFDDPFDDASPTAGNQAPSEGMSSDGGGGSAWDRLRRQAASPSSSTAASSPRSRPVSQPASSTSEQSVWAQRRQRASEHDESDPSASSSSSSWSSIDRASRPSPSDSFSFSSTDRERQLAKAEAQKAFDEQLERERRGGQ